MLAGLAVWRHVTLDSVPPHTYVIQTLGNALGSQAQGLNLRRGGSLGSKRRVDINVEQTGAFLDEICMS